MKNIFTVIFYSWLLATASTALYSLLVAFHWVWIGVLVVALSPLSNGIWGYDKKIVLNTKVRKPRVSLFVMLGVAWVLLTLPKPDWALWLTLGSLGGFLLDTYWAETDQ